MAAVMPADPAERELAAAFDGSSWPFMGEIPEAIATARAEGGFRAYEAAFMERIAPLVEFARTWPTAPLEAMYRHARSCGVHDRPSDGFDDVEPAFRIAYAVFRATLIEADRVFAEEEARAARKAAAMRPQAPVLVRAEDTILEQHGTIFEKVDDPAPMVNLGGPVVATEASEGGEDGDGNGQAAAAGMDPVAGDGPGTAAISPPAADPAGAHPHGDDGQPADPASEAPSAAALEAEAGMNEGEGGDAGELVSGTAVEPDTGSAGPDTGMVAAEQDGGADVAGDGSAAPAASADAAADPAPETPRADALEAEAKAVSPARRKR